MHRHLFLHCILKDSKFSLQADTCALQQSLHSAGSKQRLVKTNCRQSWHPYSTSCSMVRCS